MTRSSFFFPALIGLVAAQFLFVLFYLGQEQAVHFWDYAMYANMALQAWQQPTWSEFWAVFSQSFAQNYNLLFALPSFLSFSVFGGTRNVFILTNYVVFFLVHVWAISFILRRLFFLRTKEAQLWSLGLSSLVPFMWYPLLQGYPDNGAAACLVAGIGILLGHKKGWQRLFAVGALWGLAIVLRRHYAYPVLAVFLALVLTDIPHLVRQSASRLVTFISGKARFYITILAGLFVVLVGIEPHYLKEIFTTDYTSLYKSYERPASYFVLFALSRVGIVLLLASLAGLFLSLQNQKKKAPPLRFISLVSLIWLCLWSFGPAQAGEHYLISVLPILCVVGLYGLYQALRPRRFYRPVLAIGALLLVLNTAHALYFAPAFVLPSSPPRIGLFSTPRPPWVRTDLEELKALAMYLAENTTDQDKIVVAGSSFTFNQDLVRALYTDVLKNISPAYRFIPASESDGQQGPPLDAYAAATVYVIATPTQYHLAPEGQKVVTALASRFPPSSETASLFQKEDKVFRLENDVEVHIWRRKEWTPSLLHKNLAAMRSYKASAAQWVLLSTQGGAMTTPQSAQESLFMAQHGEGDKNSSFFLDRPLNVGSFRLETRVETMGSCSSVMVSASLRSGDGSPLDQRTHEIIAGQTLFYLPVTSPSAPSFLELNIRTQSAGLCTVALKQLRLEQLE